MRIEPSGRFTQALDWAVELHAGQTRKGTEIPYAAHLLSTASLVLQFGGTENQAVAALLHDAAEDQGGLTTLRRIRDRFGAEVADIVEACTDTLETPKPAWLPRKTRYIEAVATKDTDALLVTACDKLDNARAIVVDLRRDGSRTLERFTAGDRVTWYYRSMTTALEARCREDVEASPGLRSVVAELAAAVSDMERLGAQR